MNSKKNFKTVLVIFLILIAGLLTCATCTGETQFRRMFLLMAAIIGLSALVQCLLYKIKPGFFKDKPRPS